MGGNGEGMDEVGKIRRRLRIGWEGMEKEWMRLGR